MTIPALKNAVLFNIKFNVAVIMQNLPCFALLLKYVLNICFIIFRREAPIGSALNFCISDQNASG